MIATNPVAFSASSVLVKSGLESDSWTCRSVTVVNKGRIPAILGGADITNANGYRLEVGEASPPTSAPATSTS